MPLPKPTLDNRTLRPAGRRGPRAASARCAPQWTDHNASDPGITLLELVAWLAEQNIYRFDRASDEALRAFVRLVGIEPRPPGVARTVVAIAIATAAAIDLPARMQLGRERAPLFETTDRRLRVAGAMLRALARPAAPLADVTAGERDARAPSLAFGARPRPGACALPRLRPCARRAGRHAVAARVDRRMAARRRDARRAAGRGCDARRAGGHGRRRAAPTGAATIACARCGSTTRGGGAWLPLHDVVDETRALTLTGFVRFTAPVDHRRGGPGTALLHPLPHRPAAASNARRGSRTSRFNAVRLRARVERARSERSALARGHAARDVRARRSAGRRRQRRSCASTTARATCRPTGASRLDWDRAGAHDRVVPARPRARRDSERRRAARRDPPGRATSSTRAYRAGGGAGGNIAAQHADAACRRRRQTWRSRRRSRHLPTPLGVDAAVRRDRRCAARDARSGAGARVRRGHARSTRRSRWTTSSGSRCATPGVPVARVRAVAEHGSGAAVLSGAGRRSRVIVDPVLSAAGAAAEPGAARRGRALPRAAPPGHQRDAWSRRATAASPCTRRCTSRATPMRDAACAARARRASTLLRSADRRPRRQRLAVRPHRLPQRDAGAARRPSPASMRVTALRLARRPRAASALRQRRAVRARAGRARPPRSAIEQRRARATLNRSDPHECQPADEALERLNYFNGQRLAAATSAPSRAITSACGACSTARCIRRASSPDSRSSPTSPTRTA